MRNRTSRVFTILIGIMIPTIFAAIRYGVGVDYFAYVRIYNDAVNLSFSQYAALHGVVGEWFIWIIAKAARIFGGVKVYFGLYAFLMYTFFVLSTKEYTAISRAVMLFGYLMGPFTTGLNGMRQALALSICFYGLRYVYNRDLVKYLIVVLLAVLAHNSAVAAIAIYPLYSKEQRNAGFYVKMILVVLGVIFLLSNLYRIIPILSQIELFSMARYMNYFYSDVFGPGNNYRFIQDIILLSIVFLFRNKLFTNDPKVRLLFILMAAGTCTDFLGYYSGPLKRISEYFIILPNIAIISHYPRLFKKEDRPIVSAGCYAYMTSIFIIAYIIIGNSAVIPYRIS